MIKTLNQAVAADAKSAGLVSDGLTGAEDFTIYRNLARFLSSGPHFCDHHTLPPLCASAFLSSLSLSAPGVYHSAGRMQRSGGYVRPGRRYFDTGAY